MAPESDHDAGMEPPPGEPSAFVVLVEPADRIHFLDWGGPAEGSGPGVVLIHGLAATAWTWTPVARRLRAGRRTIAMDLRGHGLSDAPTEGYDRATLASDAVAVTDGAGFIRDGRGVVLAGHGFGAIVAVEAAHMLGGACRGLVLVDGGWEDLRTASDVDPDEFLRTLDEPPEVLRSMTAFLADRRGFDPRTWDADQERAARATVVETHAGRVVPVTRPHVMAAIVDAMFDYRPIEALGRVTCPVIALVAADDEEGSRSRALSDVMAALSQSGGPAIGVERYPGDAHNLMRYRPTDVVDAIVGVAADATAARATADGG
jgi:pimeloyl-ACP methyl ester carboxylesterase